MKFVNWLYRAWSRPYSWLTLLKPLEWLYRGVVKRKFKRFQQAPELSYQAAVPVVIVGNITVGGTGKTPMILWLIEYCKQQQLSVGVISRGYGAKPPAYPWAVSTSDSAAIAGDEPLLISQRSQVPVVIDPDRAQAARYLTEHYDVQLILSDDGLQHYRLARDCELVLIDGQRQLGNGYCLPCGPLREPAERLSSVDAVLFNGACDSAASFAFQVEPAAFIHLKTGERFSLDHFPQGQAVHAVAGIGNPQRFFNTLTALGYQAIPHAFADHAVFTGEEFNFADDLPVIMTEKDAVKCRAFAADNWWYLAVDARPTANFVAWWAEKLTELLQLPKEEQVNGSKTS